MSKAFSNLLKHIDKLPDTKKEQVYQWVKRYVSDWKENYYAEVKGYLNTRGTCNGLRIENQNA